MKFGIREICDVVLKAKTAQKVGNKIFYKNEPVIYFDTLKTSTMEGAATTVYAQGGRGNSRLVAWEGERTLTFTMEDALISAAGFMILSGAGLIESGGADEVSIKIHTTQTAIATYDAETNKLTAELKEVPYYDAATGEDYIYVMIMNDNGEIVSEPYIATGTEDSKTITVAHISEGSRAEYTPDFSTTSTGLDKEFSTEYKEVVVFVDYYVEHTKAGVQQIEITPDKFGGNYYLEASTLFKTEDGVDLPAEIIIPNCKIQSNFTFTMASTGDPSTFTFTMDAFPDVTRFDPTKKVLAAIQVINESESLGNKVRTATDAGHTI